MALNDDSLMEPTEEFTVTGAVLMDLVVGNFTFSPAQTTVVIEDNDSGTETPPTDPTTTGN